MQYTRLGNTGLIVSRLAFGAMTFGSARDRFYYSNGGTLRELSQATGSNMIWSKFNGIMGGGAASQTEMFFVGSEAEYMKYGYRHDPVPKHGPVTR